mgnify:CR=1 FL=1
MRKTPLANNLMKKLSQSTTQKNYSLGLVICKNCNHIQLNTEVNPKLLFNHYSYKTGISTTMVNHFTKFSRDLCEYFDKKKKSYSDIKILDIGSNDSVLLDILRSKGFKTFGVEPAFNLAKSSSHKIFNAFFDDKSIEKIYTQFGNFDVITANNVFAHTRDLNQFIKNIRYLLKEDGLISIEVQYLPNLINNCYIDMIYHEHTSYHHLKPLNKLFKKYNLTLNSVSNISTHGGSMRIILNNTPENIISFNNKNESIDFIRNDNKFDQGILNSLNLLRERIERIRLSLNTKLRELSKEYALLFGYSAPAKTVTLLSLLDKDIINKISFIIDDNELKQGRYIPRTKIPLISTNDAIERIYDRKSACIIFAWNMFEEISKKIIINNKLNPDILISPLPEITIKKLK